MSLLLTLKEIETDMVNRDQFPYRVISLIKIEDLNNFTVECINTFGSEEALNEANKVGTIVYEMLKKKKLVNEQGQQSFVDILLAAAMLHNLFYTPDNFSTLFDARRILDPIAEKHGIPADARNAIFQTIESQLGEDTPVPFCRPAPNSPSELFAWAVWFTKEYRPL